MIYRYDLTGRQRSRRTAELKRLRAELVKRLGQLDFRAENLERAFAEMARHVERTIRKLTA